jgi:hypothetical protein
MTSRSPTFIGDMLLRIPVHVRAALEDAFHLQVRTTYTKHLNDKLAAFQAAVPQVALPSLPTIVPKITPLKAAEATAEILGSTQGKTESIGYPHLFTAKCCKPSCCNRSYYNRSCRNVRGKMH